MAQHPRLRTGRRVLDRGDGELQIGTGDDALTLTGVPPALGAALSLLTGATDLADVEATCARDGVPATALHALLDALDDAGALDRGHVARTTPEPVPLDQVDALFRHGIDGRQARRRLAGAAATTVAVVGRGPLVADLVAALDGLVAEVGRVAPAGAPRGQLLLVVGRDALDPAVVGQAVLTGRPVLPVLAGTHGTVVGPWHDGPASPCPQCLDLRRTEGDPAWPRLLRQLARPAGDGQPAPVGADPVLSRLTCAVVAQWVRRRAVGLPETPGLTCEIDAWELGMTHRVWPVHPRCDRHPTEPPDAPAAPAPPPRRRARATMGA